MDIISTHKDHKDKKIKVTWVKNIVDPYNSLVNLLLDFKEDCTVRSFLSSIIKNEKLFVNLNGNFLEDPSLDLIKIKENDHITICIKPEDNSVLRVIGAVVLTVVAFYTQQYWLLGGAGYLLSGGSPLPGSPSNLAQQKASSPNYGWSNGDNGWQQGSVNPSLIGKRWFSPPRIAGYRYLPPESPLQQHLRMQFNLTRGLIDIITSDDILVNDKPLSQYPGTLWEYSPGNPDETNVSSLVPFTSTEQNINAEIPEDSSFSGITFYIDTLLDGGYDEIPVSPSYLSWSTDGEASLFIFTILAEELYYTDDKGTYQEKIRDDTFNVHVEWSPKGAGTWTEVVFSAQDLIDNFPLAWVGAATSNYQFRYYFALDLDLGQYDFRWWYTGSHGGHASVLASIVGHNTLVGDIYSTNSNSVTRLGIGLLFPEGLYYYQTDGSIGENSEYIYVRLRPTGESDWSLTRLYVAQDSNTSPFRRFMEFVGLAEDQYDIMVVRTPLLQGDDLSSKGKVYLEFIQEGSSEYIFSYPDTATLSMDIAAVDSFQQQWPTVKVRAKQADYYLGRDSRSPAWASYYRMINIYGISSSRIPFATWSNWADFCIANGLTCSIYMDAQISMRQFLDLCGQAGRAKIVPKGNNWDVIIDTQIEPNFTFGSDNILPGTFSHQWLGTQDRANTILAYYYDKDNYNLKTPVKIIHPNVDAGIEKEILQEYDFLSVDNRAQAVQLGIIILNQTILTRRVMKWQSFLDAIGCQIGYVSYLQHNQPIWGYAPGRVISANSSSVTCDIPLDFSDSDNETRIFKILIRHQLPRSGETEDFIEILPIINPYPNTDVLEYTLDGEVFERTPEEDCLVQIGWLLGTEESTGNDLLSVKKVLITGLDKREDRRFEVTACDYYDDALQGDYVVVDEPPIESGITVNNIYAGTSWAVEARVRKNYIQLLWTGSWQTYTTYYVFYQVYLSTSEEWSSWNYYGQTNEHDMKIGDLSFGLYRFSVNTQKVQDESNYYEIDFTAVDFGDALTAVQNLRCLKTGDTSWDGRDLEITFDKLDFFNLDYYRLEIVDGNGVVLREVRIERADAPLFVYTFEMNVEDNYGRPNVRVRVISVDQQGNEASTNITVFTNNPPSAPTDLLTSVGSATEFTGGDLDITWQPPHGLKDLMGYEITITHGGSDLRTQTILVNQDIFATTTSTTSTTTTSNTQSSTSSSTSTSTTTNTESTTTSSSSSTTTTTA